MHVALHPQRRPLGGVSVGTKLSAATLAVVALVAVAVYLGLSHYERRSQFLAKEKAAVMVMQLFAANLSAPLTFADATSVAETVSSVSSNPEIEFGAAWALDTENPHALGARLGVLSRGSRPPEAPRAIPPALRAQLTATHVVVEAPVKDPSGKLVGAAQLGFSTAREEAAIAAIERRVLALSMGSALGLIVILSLASRAVVVRPLRHLTHATAALKRGDKPERLIPTNDEIGELTQAFMEMSQAIEIREQRIRERNRDMLRILDNAEDGDASVLGRAPRRALADGAVARSIAERLRARSTASVASWITTSRDSNVPFHHRDTRGARADDATDLAGLLAEPVVSGASKSAEPASDAPATTSVLTAADMRRYGIRSLAEAIDFLGMGLITQDPLHPSRSAAAACSSPATTETTCSWWSTATRSTSRGTGPPTTSKASRFRSNSSIISS